MGFRRSHGVIALSAVFAGTPACGRVRASLDVSADAAAADPAAIPDATRPSATDAGGIFECFNEGAPSLHFRYAYPSPANAASVGASTVSSWVSNGGEALLSTGLGDLVRLYPDGSPSDHVRAASLGRAQELSPLADGALVQRDATLYLVGVGGDIRSVLGVFVTGSDTPALVGARFTESGAAVVSRLGYADLEHERVVAVEARGPDGTLLRRIEGVTEALVADAERLFVVASGTQVRALGPDGAELWQATYRSAVRSIHGSLNGRSIYVHNESLSFYEDADNSGLLIVDGIPRVVPYLGSPGFSPDGEWVASAGRSVVMRERGEEIWRITPVPNFLADSVGVNHLGQVLVSGSARIGDAGRAAYELHAFLYDHTGTLLTHCVGIAPGFSMFSAFDRDGASVGLYGTFGVVVYDIR